jgi:hypothetical protein
MTLARYLGFAAGLGMCLTAVPVLATDYVNNPNPACRLMRNSEGGAPSPVAPNRVDTLMAMALGGNRSSPNDRLPVIRQRYAQALPLMLKIDSEGTETLEQLPPSTPGIDLVIDRHLSNLTWTRSMLGVFYEEGRASPVDYAEAARFYQKSIDTKFTDDRGCVHGWPSDFRTLTHLAGLYAYGLGVAQDRAKAKQLLQLAGPKAVSAVYLLDHDALPKSYALFLNSDWDELAEEAKQPQPQASTSLWRGPDLYSATPPLSIEGGFGIIARVALWATCAAAVLFVWLVVAQRRESGGEVRPPLYATVYEVYRGLAKVVSRVGLVITGFAGCLTGVWMLSLAYSMGMLPWQVDLASLEGFTGLGLSVAGLAAFLGGLSKLGESFRTRHEPTNAQVHGDARPAAQEEAKKAARGIAVGPNLSAREFRD